MASLLPTFEIFYYCIQKMNLSEIIKVHFYIVYCFSFKITLGISSNEFTQIIFIPSS